MLISKHGSQWPRHQVFMINILDNQATYDHCYIYNYLDVTPSLILGPVCSYAAHGVNEFAKFWNIPMITSGAMAMAFTQEYQPTLTRITAPYTEIGEFFKTIMLQLNYWKHTIHLLYHSPEDLTKDCYFAMEAIDYVLKLQPDKFRVLDTVVQHPLCCINYEEVIKQMNEPKVVITCGSDDFVRSLMLAAKRMGLTDPKQNVWYTVDLFNASYFGHGSWQRGDQHDVDAYEAYKGSFRMLHSINYKSGWFSKKKLPQEALLSHNYVYSYGLQYR